MTDDESVTQLHSAQQAGMMRIVCSNISQPGQDSRLQQRIGWQPVRHKAVKPSQVSRRVAKQVVCEHACPTLSLLAVSWT